MSTTDVTATQVLAPGRAAGGAAPEPDRAQIRSLAQQFESMLMAQMLREMKQAMAPDADRAGLGGQLMGDTVTTELAQALGRAGGLGLAEMLGTALARLDNHLGAGRGADVEAPGLTPAPPVAGPMAPVADAAGVSSKYGWRLDPMNGQHRFHAGTDLRVAYGQDVRAATAGVVTFAGEQPGYGLVVIVAHPNGLETRYAHLSAAEVSQGATVGAGDVIARSGTSGRSTGAHLHFEVRQHGQPVDPEQVAGLAQLGNISGSEAR
jgi:murein DD-endopeptidase MepM/ murein hydrolase activator NlpD